MRHLAILDSSRRVATLALVLSAAAQPLRAQFSSDFPGVPRASISSTSARQNRTAWAFTGYRIAGDPGKGDTIAGGMRLGFGQSYRIANQFEAGYDLTLGEGSFVRSPGTDATPSSTYSRGLAAYGLRLGAKYRPISSLDPDGNGYEIAFGAGFQPQLKPLYGVEHTGDSTRSGGQFSGTTKPSALFQQDPFATLSASTIVAGMTSYRSRRLRGDAAIVSETVTASTDVDPSPLNAFSGLSLRAGGVFRLTPSIAVGGSYWGKGSPPWWDEIRFGAPGKAKQEQYGFLFQFGSDPESGVDLMVATPTGTFSESARLYIRARSTW